MQVASKKAARLLYFAVRLARNCMNPVIIVQFVDTFLISQLTYFIPLIFNFLQKKDKDNLYRLLRQISRISRKESGYFADLLEKRIVGIQKKLVACFRDDPTHPLFKNFCCKKNKRETRNGIILPKKNTEKAKKTLSYQSFMS